MWCWLEAWVSGLVDVFAFRVRGLGLGMSYWLGAWIQALLK